MRIHPPTLPLCFLLGFIAATSFAQQPPGGKEPSARPFAWIAQHDCSLAVKDGTLTVTSNGNDPYFSTSDVPVIAQPLALEFRMKSQSEGGGQLFWTTKGAADKTDPLANNIKFSVTHNALWHEYRVPFAPEAPLQSLRLDPCSGPGEIQIEALRLVDAEGIIVKQWLPLRSCDTVDGNAIIRGKVGDSEIVITTTSRLAGAIHSLTWKGKEFIDSVDHGRQLQSASSFGGLNLKDSGPFHAECYNPTEAGSRLDGAGPRSSSRLLELNHTENALQTLTQMAFWLAPWERSEKKPALNKESRSKHTVAKQVKIGYSDLPNVIQYDVTFRVPLGEQHKFAQFESLTAYMPVEFDHFYGFNAGDGELQPLTNTKGEQGLPVILATADGQYAIGVFSPSPRRDRFGQASYGRFDFREQNVMKWNCVYRLRENKGIEPGEYSFAHFVAVGDLEMVKQSLRKLHEEFKLAGWLTPDGKFARNDPQRPRPRVIAPGEASTPDSAGKPPQDATLLFNGKDWSEWYAANQRPGHEKPITWKFEKDYVEITPNTVSIRSKQRFKGDHQIHLEWQTPEVVKGNGQGRGNSGLFLGGFGEVQVLDSFNNDTYPDGQAAALYSRFPPLVNASRGPGEWQTFDIILQMTRVNERNEVTRPAMVTVLHNGVVAHHAVEFSGRHDSFDIGLQDHGNPVRFRNFWLRPLQPSEEIEKPTSK